MRIKHILLLLPLLLMAACGQKQVPVAAEPPLEPERGQVWQLVALQGRALDRAKKSPTLVFNPETRSVNGTAHCNEYTFHYTLGRVQQQPDGDHYEVQLTFWGGGTTECPEGDMSAERRYLGLLGKATAMRLTATTMTLYQKNRETLHFELQ